jgi:hypothetical protein
MTMTFILSDLKGSRRVIWNNKHAQVYIVQISLRGLCQNVWPLGDKAALQEESAVDKSVVG